MIRSIRSNGSGAVEATTLRTSRAAANSDGGANDNMQAPSVAPITIIAALNCSRADISPPTINCPPRTHAGPNSNPMMLAKSYCTFLPTIKSVRGGAISGTSVDGAPALSLAALDHAEGALTLIVN